MSEWTTKDTLDAIFVVAMGLAAMAAVAAGYAYGPSWFGTLIAAIGCVVLVRWVVRTARTHLS